jgi:glycosyltransferase involved in cell wall biosynthesis
MTSSAAVLGMAIDAFEVGGTELNALRTAESLDRRGYRLVVFHSHSDGPLFSRWQRTSHRLVHTPVSSMRSMRFAVDVQRLGRTIRQHNVSLVHCQDVYTNIWVSLADRMLSLPPIITSRRWDREVPRRGFATLNAMAHRRSALVTVNSSRLLARVVSEGVSANRVAFVPNFIEPQKFRDREQRRKQLRDELGIEPSQYVVGMVGRLVPVKRFDLAIQAFARFASTVAQAILIIVGDGPDAALLRSLVESLGLVGRVRFLGHRTDSWSVPAAFDCSLLSSDHEGFANVLLEAAANGVPVVATDVGGAEEVLGVVGGRAVPTGDVSALASSLLERWHQYPESYLTAQRSASIVQERFSEVQVIGDLLDAYASVCGPSIRLLDFTKE